jgi:hypothetical protein
VRSWLELRPKPAVFVFGNAPGTAEYCAEFGLTHILDALDVIDGTGKIRDMAAKVESASEAGYFCFINADIILTSSMMQAIPAVTARLSRFLLGVSPWNVDVNEELTFAPGWEDALERRAQAENALRSHRASDLFLYPRGFLAAAPELVIGRWWTDNGLMWYARRTGAALIDGTPGILAVHQNHTYGHLGEHASDLNQTAGAIWNVHVIGGRRHIYSWSFATHYYTRQGLRPYWIGRLLHWLPYTEPTDGMSRVIASLIWKPLSRITRPIRTALGLTNPRFPLKRNEGANLAGPGKPWR